MTLVLEMDPGASAADAMRTLRVTAEEHPGSHPLTVKAGERTLSLGETWRYSGSPECLAKLGRFGRVRVLAEGEEP
jgi:hypothetical protein